MDTILLFSLALSLSISFVTCVESPLTYATPSSCLENQNETFSSVKLECVKCQWDDITVNNESRSSLQLRIGGPGSCRPCPLGYWKAANSCHQCRNGTVSADSAACLQCTQDTFNPVTGKCSPCPLGHVLVTRSPNGEPKNIFECHRCADGMTPSRSNETCSPCHPSFSRKSVNGTCFCLNTVINGICIQNQPKIDEKNLYKIHYTNDKTIESTILTQTVISAYSLCEAGKNETACQILANACTLQLYYAGEDNACKLYEKLLNQSEFDAGIRHVLPKLYYEDHYFLNLQSPDFIPTEFTSDFRERSSDFNLTVAKYSITGQFLGLSLLTDLLPCQGHLVSKQIKQKFGVTTRTKCKLRIQDFLKIVDTEMEFWDVFVSMTEVNQKPKLYSIPVKIMNLDRNGIKVNEAEEKRQWQLVRRFFVADTVGGFEVGVNDLSTDRDRSSKIPRVVRYIEEISVSIQLQHQENPGRVFIPVVTVSYNEIVAEDLSRNGHITFSYELEYFMDMHRALEDIKISVGVISALAVLWAAIQTWTWNRRNGRAEIDLETILTLVLTSCGNIADAFVIVTLGTGMYWWIFFKKQVAVHVFLPQPTQERLIRDLLIAAFALKVVDMVKLIGRQVSLDIFFVDWEKPKAGTVTSVTEDKSGRSGIDLKPSVSIWRSYFVANEWNEIQATRKINMAFHLVLTLLFLEVFGFKYWGLHWPSTSLSPGEKASDVPFSTVARFTTSTLMFIVLGIVQWIFKILIYERFVSNKIQDFVDICTLANVSVFILAAKQYGYYIHGRSIHGFADTDMRTMVEQLNREEEDLCGRRGLVATYDQQTFIISVPRSLRTVYDQVLQPLYAQSSKFLSHVTSTAKTTSGSKSSAGHQAPVKPSMSQVNLSAHAYHSMNRFLTSFLEHGLSDIDYEVSDKSFIEASLDMEFRYAGDRAVFYNDDGHSFDAVLFYGNERALFLFNLCLFNFVDLLSHNFVLAAILTFMADMGLKAIRKSLGKRNLARKTLIDRRFLM